MDVVNHYTVNGQKDRHMNDRGLPTRAFAPRGNRERNTNNNTSNN